RSSGSSRVSSPLHTAGRVSLAGRARAPMRPIASRTSCKRLSRLSGLASGETSSAAYSSAARAAGRLPRTYTPKASAWSRAERRSAGLMAIFLVVNEASGCAGVDDLRVAIADEHTSVREGLDNVVHG